MRYHGSACAKACHAYHAADQAVSFHHACRAQDAQDHVLGVRGGDWSAHILRYHANGRSRRTERSRLLQAIRRGAAVYQSRADVCSYRHDSRRSVCRHARHKQERGGRQGHLHQLRYARLASGPRLHNRRTARHARAVVRQTDVFHAAQYDNTVQGSQVGYSKAQVHSQQKQE